METLVSMRMLTGLVAAVLICIICIMILFWNRRSNSYEKQEMIPLNMLPTLFAAGKEFQHKMRVQGAEESYVVQGRLSDDTVTVSYKFNEFDEGYFEEIQVDHTGYLGLVIQLNDGVIHALQRMGGKILYNPVLTPNEKVSLTTFVRQVRSKVRKNTRR